MGRRDLGQALSEIYGGGFSAIVVRRLEHQAVAESFRYREQHAVRDKELIAEYADLLDTASVAVGRKLSSAVQLQRLLKLHGRFDLAKRVAFRARGRHAAAHPTLAWQQPCRKHSRPCAWTSVRPSNAGTPATVSWAMSTSC